MLNTISFLDFKNSLSNNKKVGIRNNYQTRLFNFSGANLQPLAADTVSFSGTLEQKIAIGGLESAKDLNKNAQYAASYFENVFKDDFSALIYDEENNPKGIVKPIKGRVKTPESIEEKVAKKHEYSLIPENYDKHHFCPRNTDHIKEKVRDIIGTRIVMRDSSKKSTQEIVDALCKTITEKKLVVTQIENIISDVPGDRSYFSREQLSQIKEAANKIRVENGLKELNEEGSKEDREYRIETRKSGYAALHIDFDLRNVGRTIPERGYYGELQIIGADVEMLKEIEDFCYKLNDPGKEIKAGHFAYKPFETFYREALSDENYPNSEEYFAEYTKKAFVIQRKRKTTSMVQDNPANWTYMYPTLKECGLEDKLSPNLDFNILARIRRDCDDLYKVSMNAKDILDGKIQ